MEKLNLAGYTPVCAGCVFYTWKKGMDVVGLFGCTKKLTRTFGEKSCWVADPLINLPKDK